MKRNLVTLALLVGFSSGVYAAGSDTIAISNLCKRVNQFGLDISQVGQTMAENASLQVQAGNMAGTSAAEMSLSCLQRLTITNDELSEQLNVLRTSTSLSDMAVNAIDRRSAIEMSKLTVDQSEEMLPLLRTSISHTMGDCPQSPVVAAKAQQLISLISDSDSAMAALAAKYGHSKYSDAK